MNAGEDHRKTDVIPSLMDLLGKAVQDLHKKRGSVKKAHEDIGSHLGGKSERQVRRYFEEESSPPAAELEALVAAVAVESNRDRMTFWRQAIDSADDEIRRIGLDPRREAGEAVQAARRAESD